MPKSAHPDPREAPVRPPPGLFRQFQRKFTNIAFCAARDIREGFLLLPADDGPPEGYLSSVSSKRISEASRPSKSLKRNSRRFVVAVLHGDPMQSKEVATLGDDLPRKRDRRVLPAARPDENSEQLRTGEHLRPLR